VISASGSGAEVLKKKPSYFDEMEHIIGKFKILLQQSV
jgi:hypothetical protein